MYKLLAALILTFCAAQSQNPSIKLMDTSKLQINEVYTYSELCKLLNEPSKGGNSKPSHLRELARYFKIEEIAVGKRTKYKISEIYPVAHERQVRALTEDAEELSLLFLSCLSVKVYPNLLWMDVDLRKVFYTKSTIHTLCCFFNDKYYQQRNALLEGKCEDYAQISHREITSFYNKTYKIFSDTTRDMLNALAKRKVIIFEDAIQVWDSKHIERRYATDEERAEIKAIGLEIKCDIGLKPNANLFFISPKKRSEYFSERKARIEKQLNLYDAKYGYLIRFTKEFMDRVTLDKADSYFCKDKKYIKLSVNRKICAKVKEKAAKEYDEFAIEHGDLLINQEENKRFTGFNIDEMFDFEEIEMSDLPKSLTFKRDLFRKKDYLKNFNSLVNYLMRLPDDEV